MLHVVLESSPEAAGGVVAALHCNSNTGTAICLEFAVANVSAQVRRSIRATAVAVFLGVTSTMVEARTITLRSLESTSSSSSSLPSNSSFVFDGTNSDIAQQLYIRHKAGDTDAKLSLNSVPTAVIKRLDPLSIVFTELPGLVQRAVLWDTGFAISPSNDPVQIWTMDDYTMADLAVPKDDVRGGYLRGLGCDELHGLDVVGGR
ncbi:hypothetical protein ON010_g3374 [Phytophthora cinnamomi]|nr:hypothetical protein ON010_g3374 [Phytophthora cinnamomi]